MKNILLLLLLFIPFFAFANFEIIPNQVSLSNMSSTGAHVTATMNSDGSVSGDIYLWYGEGDSLSSSKYIGINAPGGPGIYINGVTIGASLSGLSPDTQYSFRWIVVSSTGSIIYYSNQTTFITGSSSNSTPTDIVISSSEISEDSEVGSIVGSLSTSDIDSGDQFTYSLVSGDGDSGNSNFSIDGNNLLSASTFDAEIIPSYSIRIQTDDGKGGVFSKSFNISITTGEDPSDNSLPTYVPTNGLVAYYPFNGSANDESGNGYNLVNNNVIFNNDRFENQLSSAYFSGNGSELFLENSINQLLTEDPNQTFSFWFKSVTPNNRYIFDYGSQYSKRFNFVMLPDDKIGVGGEYAGCQSSRTVYEAPGLHNGWHHFVVSINSSDYTVYYDGEVLFSKAHSGFNCVDSNNKLNIGNDIGGGAKEYTNMIMDDIGIWDRALTEQEVTNLYNSETTAQVPSYVPTDGLVGYWPFNGNANDASGNGNNGTVNGATLTPDKDGNENSAYSFDGVVSKIYFNLNSIENTIPPQSELTTSVWIKSSDLNGPLISMRGTDGILYDFNIGTLSDVLKSPGNYGIFVRDGAGGGGTGNNEFGSNVADNNWHMLTIVRYSNGSIRLYKDGQLEEVTNPGNSGELIFSPEFMTFGAEEVWIQDSQQGGCGSCNTVDEQHFNGELDDIGIWNRALTEQEVTNLYNSETTAQVPSYVPTEGLVGYWPFNGNANDETGNGNNGTVNGATLTNDRDGNENSSFSFDGVDDYIELNNSFFGGSNSVGSFTIYTLLKVSSYNTGTIFGKEGYWRLIRLQNVTINNKNVFWFGGSQPSPQQYFNIQSNSEFELNRWYNLIITFNDGELKMFVDGELDNSKTISLQTLDWSFLTAGNSTSTNHFGRFLPVDGNHNYFSGEIDDFGIWNRALTEEEVTNLFNSDLSTTDFSDNSIKIYPNPVKNILIIDGLDIQDVVIYSVLGKAVLKISNQNTIDISSLSKGVYFIKISDGINASTKKFIKE